MNRTVSSSGYGDNSRGPAFRSWDAADRPTSHSGSWLRSDETRPRDHRERC
jgi:hypothetical protein